MQAMFLFDDNTHIVVNPEALRLVQLAADQAALGVDVQVPELDENKQPVLNADGSPKTKQAFRPLINYAMNFSVPKAEAAVAQTPESL